MGWLFVPISAILSLCAGQVCFLLRHPVSLEKYQEE